LVTHGIEIKVLFFIDSRSAINCPTYQALSTQGISCLMFPWLSSTEQKIRWILSTLAADPPDVFVPHMMIAGFYASRWVKAAGIPTVGVIHSDDEFYRGVLRTFVFGKPAYQLSAIACVSEFLEQTVKSLGQTTSAIWKIPCGVPLPSTLAQPPSDTLKLIYVGRLTEEQKRISDVTRALCRVVREVPHTEATLYGDGADRANVEKILMEEGKGLPVRLAGKVDSHLIQALMLQTHALVLLSDYEGLPIALMEAMACGVVPICLKIRSGIPELVQDGENGLLVDDRGDSLIAAVRRLQAEPKLWLSLSQAAYTRIATTYSEDVCTASWLHLLETLTSLASVRQPISNPRLLGLPSTDPGFAWEDRRRFRFARRQLRHKLGAVKQKLLIKLSPSTT
jgi:glycosyltransferase involved in cell wall biosynthesis